MIPIASVFNGDGHWFSLGLESRLVILFTFLSLKISFFLRSGILLPPQPHSSIIKFKSHEVALVWFGWNFGMFLNPQTAWVYLGLRRNGELLIPLGFLWRKNKQVVFFLHSSSPLGRDTVDGYFSLFQMFSFLFQMGTWKH